MARFEREARMLAALNHPHIGAIYAVEEADGVHALVLELVEGDTLAERIAKGLSVTEALSFARESPTRSRRRTKRGSSTAISSRRM